MKRGGEEHAIRATEAATGVFEKMDGMQSYVNEFLQNDMQVLSLIRQGFSEKISQNQGAAELYAKQNQFLIPNDVKELGPDHEIAFVLALAQELSKPEYNQ